MTNEEKAPTLPVTPSEAHVVVVEDNADNLLIILKLLRMMGVERLNWRTTGKQVVEFVRDMSPVENETGPELILLDIGLPGEDGYEVLAELRADPRLRHTRVVAVTMLNSPEEMKRARAAGFNGFIGKPIDAGRFPDQIQRLFDGAAVWEQ